MTAVLSSSVKDQRWLPSTSSIFQFFESLSYLVYVSIGWEELRQFSTICSTVCGYSTMGQGLEYFLTRIPQRVDAHFNTLNWLFSNTYWILSSAMKQKVSAFSELFQGQGGPLIMKQGLNWFRASLNPSKRARLWILSNSTLALCTVVREELVDSYIFQQNSSKISSGMTASNP